jgi:vitamin B12 transporter
MVRAPSGVGWRTTAALCRWLWSGHLAGASALALAQNPAQAPAELPPLVAMGSRLPATPSSLAQSLTVLNQREIQALNAAKLSDLLNRQTGIYVGQAGKTGSVASLSMRGAGNSHLLMLVDGVKVNDPNSPRGSTYDLSAIDLAQVERIDILRGPASAVHGGDALAGVLNIVTQAAVPPGVQGSGYVGLGQDGLQRVGGDVGFGGSAWSGHVSAGRAQEGSHADDAWQRTHTYSGRLRANPGSGSDAEVWLRRTEHRSEALPADSGGPRLAVLRGKTSSNASDTVAAAQGSMALTPNTRMHAGFSDYERREQTNHAAVDAGLRNPVPASVGDSEFRSLVTHLGATRLWGAASGFVGAEYQIEKGRAVSVGDFFGTGSVPLTFDVTRRTQSLAAEGRIQAHADLSIQAGLRLHKIEHSRREVMPQLGAVWHLGGGATTLKATYGQGIQAPSFFALGHPLVGNPKLKPQRSRNLELSLVQRMAAEPNTIQVSVFQTRIDDLIDLDGINAVAQNRGGIVIQGIEPALTWQAHPGLRMQLGATLLDIEARDDLGPLRNRPQRRATASAAHDLDERSSVHAALNSTASFLDRSNLTGDVRLGGFTTLDLSYALRLRSVQLRGALDNALDRGYEQYVGFPAQRRRLRIELRADF